MPPTANTGMETCRDTAANSSRFHTDSNGARVPPHHSPALRLARRSRLGAARSNRVAIALLVLKLSGASPRDNVVSGNTDTVTGVTASYPHSCTNRASSIASVRLARGMPGGATSAGTFTVHG